MNTANLISLFQTHLHHLYDEAEIRAMARAYVEDLKPDLQKSDAYQGLSERIKTDLETLAAGCPLQYVTGVQWFHNRPFKVNRSVLIPRPETEEMIGLIIDRWNRHQGRVLDIGTGSGCIAITLALELEGAKLTATDISEGALGLAQLNAHRLNAGVEWLSDDIFHSTLTQRSWELIVSNPPYIPAAESMSMHPNVMAFEPSSALFVPTDDPMLYYRAIGKYAAKHLVKGGELWLEIHHLMEHPIRELFQSLRADIVILSDMSGKRRFAYITFT